MTAADCHRYFFYWRQAHEALHGALTVEDVQLAHEIIDFVVTCAQAEQVFDDRQGEPFHSELAQESQET